MRSPGLGIGVKCPFGLLEPARGGEFWWGIELSGRAAGAVQGKRKHAMKMIKGPAIFLAQFAGDAAPFNSFDSICGWAASLGYEGVQIPTWDGRLFDLKRASESQDYADEVKGIAARHGLAITELSTHLQGQLVAVHPAYDAAFDGFAVPEVRGNSNARK